MGQRFIFWPPDVGAALPLLIFGGAFTTGGGVGCCALGGRGAARAEAGLSFPDGSSGCGGCGGGAGAFFLMACICAIAATVAPVTFFRALTIPLWGSRSSSFG